MEVENLVLAFLTSDDQLATGTITVAEEEPQGLALACGNDETHLEMRINKEAVLNICPPYRNLMKTDSQKRLTTKNVLEHNPYN